MNTPMNSTPPHNQSDTSVKDRVFSQITEQHVQPRACYVYWCQNSGMWLVWLGTVLLGALATAVLVFTSTYRYYDIYEAMHDNFFTFFVQALPIIWIGAFVVLMLVAARGLRATRRGYRLSPWLVGGSSVGASVLLGLIGSMAGFGFWFDQVLGTYSPMYQSQAEREQVLWQNPAEGRLIGTMDTTAVQSDSHITFVDSLGVAWTMDTSELRPRDKELLASDQQVRVLGREMIAKSDLFHACGVFPWMLDQSHKLKNLSAERQTHMDSLYQHADTPATRLQEFEQVAFGGASADNEPSMKVCAEIAAVRRVSDKMR